VKPFSLVGITLIEKKNPPGGFAFLIYLGTTPPLKATFLLGGFSWGVLFLPTLSTQTYPKVSPPRGGELLWIYVVYKVLILGKVRVRSYPSPGNILGSCKVGSSDVPRFLTALTTSSIESVASVFRKIQCDKSIGPHA